MDLSTIKVKTKNKNTKRKGRGVGSTLGKTAGRGHKGAGQRSGKVAVYAGHRGDSLPFHRLLPKRGFTPPRKKEYQTVNLKDIQIFFGDVTQINPKVLAERNIIKDANKPVKVLAKTKEEFKLKVTFTASAFSAKAKELIEAAGGSTQCLKQ